MCCKSITGGGGGGGKGPCRIFLYLERVWDAFTHSLLTRILVFSVGKFWVTCASRVTCSGGKYYIKLVISFIILRIRRFHLFSVDILPFLFLLIFCLVCVCNMAGKGKTIYKNWKRANFLQLATRRENTTANSPYNISIIFPLPSCMMSSIADVNIKTICVYSTVLCSITFICIIGLSDCFTYDYKNRQVRSWIIDVSIYQRNNF